MVKIKDIPFSKLKIDRTFACNAVNDSSARTILKSSIDIARKLKMKIVTKGAKTKENRDLVEKSDCNYVQDHYCAKPMPNEDLLAFVENWTDPH